MSIELDIRIDSDLWQCIEGLEAICFRAADAVNASGSADLLLTDNTAMHALNKEWRGKDKPTDVLSFPNDLDLPDGPGAFLGDVAIGFEILKSDAAAGGKTLEAHLSHLLIHGLLHLKGYDHIEEDDAQIMEALEISALKQLGFANPYSQAGQ